MDLLFPAFIKDLAIGLHELAGDAWWIVTAESCTGGLLAAALTDIAGSSRAFNRGFITYSNEAKADLVNVDPALIASRGAVSREVARAMARGACDVTSEKSSDGRRIISAAITGIAGPGGGSPHKPVGLVHFGVAMTSSSGRVVKIIDQEQRFGDLGRAKIREKAVETALLLLRQALTAQIETAARRKRQAKGAVAASPA